MDDEPGLSGKPVAYNGVLRPGVEQKRRGRAVDADGYFDLPGRPRERDRDERSARRGPEKNKGEQHDRSPEQHAQVYVGCRIRDWGFRIRDWGFRIRDEGLGIESLIEVLYQILWILESDR